MPILNPNFIKNIYWYSTKLKLFQNIKYLTRFYYKLFKIYIKKQKFDDYFLSKI